jgi:hypothetical protein
MRVTIYAVSALLAAMGGVGAVVAATGPAPAAEKIAFAPYVDLSDRRWPTLSHRRPEFRV